MSMRFLKGFIIILLLCVTGDVVAQKVTYRIEGGKRVVQKISPVDSLTIDSLRMDSLLMDSLMIDSLVRDSLMVDSLRMDSLMVDSLGVEGAFLTPSLVVKRDSTLSDATLASDSLVAARNLASLERRLDLRRDTIRAGAHLALSLIPGMGQYYNNQYIKMPVFYAGIGGFLTGGIVASSSYNKFKTQWQTAVNLNQPAEVTETLERKMQRAGSVRTVMYSLAAATYLYQIADATFNYRGYSNPVRKSTVLAAVFPCAGFVYTKTYWRIPIYYAGFITIATVIDYNNRNYQRYKTAYNNLTDGNPATVDEFNGRYSADAISSVRDSYRRDRDFGILCMAGAYVLSILDTYVIASLKNWDVSPDLAVRVEPTIFNTNSVFAQSSGLGSGAGMSLKVTF